ncbi:putative leucine-rich repeat-containing protein DDB_G0290503 isoform X1 [Linepithema humile]|uniref:putative leucine-rich repeat-containing protein DDB_G0290503 isoform X1 n=2 Tax=Linepithema humile TaxID=83485 RepID=UPI00351DF3C8
MGNTRSQPCRRSKPPYLFYLIHRTWNVVIDHRKDRDRCDDTDKETDLSSKCSTCNVCAYRQDSLIFDSESDMAPNAEEELLVVKPWGPQPEKERLRPPTYNAEDYAIALRRWGRRPLGTVQDFQGTLPSTTSSSSGYASGSGEMTLRQFTSVSELLNKLRADLRLAFPSFVQEFASPPADGITLLLETLRGVQLAQSSPPNTGHAGPKIGTRRAALDELGCVECLAACGERCADAPRLLVQAQPGLLALAVCLTSSLNRSRVLALQLLTKVCQAPGGHAAVSEAVSTLRLKYGEGGRFRFLAGALLAPRAAIALRVAGVSFLNAFLKSAPRTQTRLYIQAEACEAGLEPQVLQEWLREFDGREEDALTDLLHKEVQKWTHNCVDVDALQRRVMRAEETCRILSEKVSFLQIQLEKRNDRNLEERDKSTSIILTAANPKSPKVSSNAEDEGISSSERSSSPEDTKPQVRTNRQKNSPSQSNDQETTIDDVIEELRIIVKDAEEEFSDKIQELNHRIVNHDQDAVRNEQELVKGKLYRSNSKISLNNSESYMYDKVSKREKHVNLKTLRPNVGSNAPPSEIKGEQVTYFGNDRDYSSHSSSTKRLSPNEPRRSSKSSMEGSVKIVVKGPDVEEAIVPAILHPQPPRRAPPCLSAIMAARHCDFADQAETYNSHDEEAEEETLGDGSDSLLSASRLKYNGKHQMYDEQMRNVNADQLQKQAKSDTILIGSNHTDMFRKSLDDLRFEKNDAKDRKVLRSYEISKESKSKVITDVRPLNKQIDRQFESISKGLETSSGRSADQRRHNSKYRSEVEKRKYLRRSASHDYLESNVSSPQSRRSGSRVECRIRKFESLNSFDEHRSLQNYGRLNGSENLDKRERAMLLADFSRSKMRRSESFHHVSHHALKRDQCSSKGESDSGLFYITDFNLEPLVARRPRSVDAPKSPSLLTKSLDRIDEGLDSMVDIVIMQEQNQWNAGKRQSKVNKSRDEKLTRSRSVRPDDFGDSSSEFNKPIKRDNSALKNRNLKNVNNKQLKNDEFYEEQRTREWNYHNELNYARSKNEMSSEDSPVILPKNNMRHNSFCQKDNISNKFPGKPNESGIFAGRTYDTFGLGKSRFNAGKYSGNQQIKESPIGRRNTTSSLIGKRGKVTDIVSGLY